MGFQSYQFWTVIAYFLPFFANRVRHIKSFQIEWLHINYSKHITTKGKLLKFMFDIVHGIKTSH